MRQVPRVPALLAARRLTAAAERWSREEEPRARSGWSRRAVEADFLGGLSGANHGVWEESPRSLRYLCGSPRR